MFHICIICVYTYMHIYIYTYIRLGAARPQEKFPRRMPCQLVGAFCSGRCYRRSLLGLPGTRLARIPELTLKRFKYLKIYQVTLICLLQTKTELVVREFNVLV